MNPIQRKSLIAVSSLAVLLSLGACGREDDRTAGEQLDAAVARTDAAAERAKEEAQAAAANTEQAAQNAADATRTAGANAAQETREAGARVGDAATGAAATAGQQFDDASITAKVNAGLAADKDLSAIRIDVDTENGVVTLSGPAPTDAAKERAAEIAKNVEGVNSVNNKLTVRSS